MKYDQLASDIINILHSSDNDFILKLYDNEGNTTLSVADTLWCFIENKNIMLKMMTEKDPTIYIWKDNNSEGTKIKTLIQRIRELAVLNGVSVQIRLFNNLDQRKIYNLIKQSMEETMNESYTPLVKSIYSLTNIIKQTKKASDFYLSESMQTKTRETLYNSMVNELSNFSKFNKIDAKIFESLLLPASFKDIMSKMSILEEKKPEFVKLLSENIDTINNIGEYIKVAYLNDKLESSDKKFISVNGLTKVYEEVFTPDNKNLTEAYNTLISVLNTSSTGTDVLRAIKRYKICETFNIEKDQLLDFWLSKDNKLIKESKGFILKNLNDESIVINEKHKLSIPVLESFLNNGGKSDDDYINSIIEVNEKVLHIQDLLENHYINNNARKYLPLIKKIYKESLDILNGDVELPLNENINYSRELKKIEKVFTYKHPALISVALEEAKVNKEKYNNTLFESRKDDCKLRAELINHVNMKRAKEISESIIRNKLISPNKLSENIETKSDCVNMARSLYNRLSTVDTKTGDILNTIMYSVMNNPSTLSESKIRFFKTLRKYIL